MALDLDSIIRRGGRKLINLLDYSVRSVQPDMLFLCLVEEYRAAPTARKAVALYEAFCKVNAAARLSLPEILPPLNPHLAAAIRPLAEYARGHFGERATGCSSLPPLLPAKFLFDAVATRLRADSRQLRSIRRNYRVSKTPMGNLGGQLTAGQRFFVDRVWRPIIRPALAEAGYRQVSSLG